MKRKLFIVFINISIACTLLVGAELLGQIIYYLKTGHHYEEHYLHRQVFELHPYLAVRLKKNVVVQEDGKTITTTGINTRWTGAPPNDQNLIRIAVLGGSTTFGAGVTDKDTWPALLQGILGDRYAVINYGVDGYSTAEAIIQMSLLVPEKSPHIIIFYEGWNDIHNYHDAELGPDYYSHGMKQYTNQNIEVFCKNKSFSEKASEVSIIFRFASKIHSALFDKKSDAAITPTYTTPDPFVDRIYVRNLRTLKLLARGMNATALFIPQVLNYSVFKGEETSNDWTPFIKNDAMPALMDRFNALMNGVCLPQESDCRVLNDVLREKWEPSDFIDEGHFSRKGGLKFAEIVARYITVTMKMDNPSVFSIPQQSATPGRSPAALHNGM
jgi:lysophospholipase L1-like esterase